VHFCSKNTGSLLSIVPQINRENIGGETDQFAHIALQKEKFKDYKKKEAAGSLFVTEKNFHEKLKEASNPNLLLKTFDNNRLLVTPYTYVLILKKLSSIVPGYFERSEQLRKQALYSKKDINIPHIDSDDRRVYSIFRQLEMNCSQFTLMEKISLLSSFSYLAKYMKIHYLMEIIFFSAFREEPEKINTLETKALVQMLSAYTRAGFTNTSILAMIVVEIDDRIKRFKELKQNVLFGEIPEQERAIMVPNDAVRNTSIIYSFDPKSLVSFIWAFSHCNLDEKATLEKIVDDMLAMNVFTHLDLFDLAKLLSSTTFIKELKPLVSFIYKGLLEKKDDIESVEMASKLLVDTIKGTRNEEFETALLSKICSKKSEISAKNIMMILRSYNRQQQAIPRILARKLSSFIFSNSKKLNMKDLISLTFYISKNPKFDESNSAHLDYTNLMKVLMDLVELKKARLDKTQISMLKEAKDDIALFNKKIIKIV